MLMFAVYPVYGPNGIYSRWIQYKVALISSSKYGTMTLICMANQNAELPVPQGLVQRSLCNLDGPTHAFSETSVRNTRKRDVVFF